jgi:hypothetical protein
VCVCAAEGRGGTSFTSLGLKGFKGVRMQILEEFLICIHSRGVKLAPRGSARPLFPSRSSVFLLNWLHLPPVLADNEMRSCV